ncbi:hypothetical protein C3B51_12465 [Pseudoalteromonas rubra]|uniref:Antitoxin SocA-like Panacea domain-containing protein n=1 Tax=Pseudoalteromonas rubra TaxID=43658 RepID=A0A4Q7EG49_9GAMM|nr:Panacea domain-containing protein [Pseudoalteromonas rubra]RZM80366.1 hypothetical protein C3B51_12465 [Pseudoalteromonas rubra]
MKNPTINIIKYILLNYPHKDELSASRLTKMLYLVDWKSSLDSNRQITNANWFFNHYGPYVEDFIEMARLDRDIVIEEATTFYGGYKQMLRLEQYSSNDIYIGVFERGVVDFVISATKDKHYDEFIQLVYSTYPVVSSQRYSHLDLVAKAREYKAHLSRQ